MRTKPMAKYFLPGVFFAEDTTRELPERSVEAALAAAPDGAFSFRLYDQPVCDFEFPADLFQIIPIAQNEGPTHYIGGEVFTPDEMRALANHEGKPGAYDTVISNVECNGWGRAIRCRTGNWQPFEEDDVLVEEVPF